jgi:hypothetical protein
VQELRQENLRLAFQAEEAAARSAQLGSKLQQRKQVLRRALQAAEEAQQQAAALRRRLARSKQGGLEMAGAAEELHKQLLAAGACRLGRWRRGYRRGTCPSPAASPRPCWMRGPTARRPLGPPASPAAGQDSGRLAAALGDARQQLQLAFQQQEQSAQREADAAQQLAAAGQERDALRAALASQERGFRAALERSTSLVRAEMAHMQAVVQVGGQARAMAPCVGVWHGRGASRTRASRAALVGPLPAAGPCAGAPRC